MFEEVLKLIIRYPTIIIHRHSYPDGDAMGSQLGLAALLRANFPEKKVYVVGDEAARLPFLNAVMDDVADEVFKSALCIILDCGGAHMVCDERYKTAAATVRIDHHIFCGKVGDVDISDSSFESASGMVAMLAKESGFKLTLEAATLLYMGMVTDSGRFAFDSVSARTFELAAYLMSQPIDLNALNYDLNAEDFSDILAKADNMRKIKFTDHNVAYIYTAREDLPQNTDVPIVSTGYVSLMHNIKGVHVWVNFTEADDGVHCELRSNDPNINPVAVKYGGGGHKKASGCIVPDKATAMKLLADLDEIAATCMY